MMNTSSSSRPNSSSRPQLIGDISGITRQISGIKEEDILGKGKAPKLEYQKSEELESGGILPPNEEDDTSLLLPPPPPISSISRATKKAKLIPSSTAPSSSISSRQQRQRQFKKPVTRYPGMGRDNAAVMRSLTGNKKGGGGGVRNPQILAKIKQHEVHLVGLRRKLRGDEAQLAAMKNEGIRKRIKISISGHEKAIRVREAAIAKLRKQ